MVDPGVSQEPKKLLSQLAALVDGSGRGLESSDEVRGDEFEQLLENILLEPGILKLFYSIIKLRAFLHDDDFIPDAVKLLILPVGGILLVNISHGILERVPTRLEVVLSALGDWSRLRT